MWVYTSAVLSCSLKKNSVIFCFRFIKISHNSQISFGSRVEKLRLFSDRKVANDLGIVRNFAIVYRQGIGIPLSNHM